jgi:hypothetical protein
VPDIAPRLRDLSLKAAYDSGDNLLSSFYVPVLSRATRYDRSVGFFRSSSLAAAARGVARFVHHGGRMRLLCGAELTEEDRDALLGAREIPSSLAKRLASELVPDDEVVRRRLEVLAFLAREGRLEVRVALAQAGDGCFHEKIGVLWDTAGDGVAFQGSANESAVAWQYNFEAFSVFCSFDAGAGHFAAWANKFEVHWAGAVPGYTVVALPEAARDALLNLAPSEPPPLRDPEEATPIENDPLVARYLAAAPRLVGAEALAEATSTVRAFPHQHQVVARLADDYPRSWLVADEVGLGKTISAGLALRRLILSGQVRRAVILAPANVCRQWQDELFEKFGLWVPRLERAQLFGAHPDDVEAVGANDNPFDRPLLIASSHLARRPEQRRRLLDAGPWDLVILDEAHHARRRDFLDLSRYRPVRLLALLDELTATRAARALWLLTATPMQVHPVELVDLLRHVGLRGALANQAAFLRFFTELDKPDDKIDWPWLAHSLAATPRLPAGPAEQAVLDGIETRIGPLGRARVERFATPGADPATLADELGPRGRGELRTWIRQLGPTGQHLTRHTRATLRRYHEQGRLDQRLPTRRVSAVAVAFHGSEADLYADLDDLIERLAQAQGTRRSGFLQTVYRRRLTSSWAAIDRSLRRRLNGTTPEPDDDELEDAEEDLEEDSSWEDGPALSQADRAQIEGYLRRVANVADSKFDRLRVDLDEARASGQAVIIFTQFTDTLNSLRDRLVGVYGAQLATFTGEGGHQFQTDEGWTSVSKMELVEALQARRVSVILATDAASEGLNLQAASFLVNFDMPWNPMRVEQRIGRIDRLGQAREVVEVRNYFVTGTVEERVYAALGRRIDLFSGMVGALQPILGATERALRAIFRTPRSERTKVEHRQVDELLGQLEQLDQSGLELADEDPMPEPAYLPAPVDLDDLRTLAGERFGIVVDRPGRPATWDPNRASRDPESWASLATYGHPVLDDQLERLACRPVLPGAALVIASAGGTTQAAVRADRSPPVPIGRVAEIDELGAAAASGDAESLAGQLARAEQRRRQVRSEAVDELLEGGYENDIRRRFTDLAHRMISAECAAAAVRDERKEPGMAWLELRRDTYSGWAYATAFAQQLGLDVTKVAAPSLIDTNDQQALDDDQLRTLRRTTGRELQALIRDWQVRQSTPATAGSATVGGRS